MIAYSSNNRIFFHNTIWKMLNTSLDYNYIYYTFKEKRKKDEEIGESGSNIAGHIDGDLC